MIEGLWVRRLTPRFLADSLRQATHTRVSVHQAVIGTNWSVLVGGEKYVV